MVKGICEHILKAKEEALKRNIEANTIIIDKDIAYCEMLYAPQYGCYSDAMIFGLKIEYTEHPLPFDAHFLLYKNDYVNIRKNKEEAFDIIKEKKVNINKLLNCEFEYYNAGRKSQNKLTEEEYNFLRSML